MFAYENHNHSKSLSELARVFSQLHANHAALQNRTLGRVPLCSPGSGRFWPWSHMYLNMFEGSGARLDGARPRQGHVDGLAGFYRGHQPAALGHNVIPLGMSSIWQQ